MLQCPGVPLGVSLAGDTTVLADTTQGVDGHQGYCGGAGTPENVYAVTPTDPGTLIVTLAGIAGADPILYAAVGACAGGTPLFCADATGASGTETITLQAIPGTTYWIYTDGHGPGQASLTLHLAAGVPGDNCPGVAINLTPANDPHAYGDTSFAGGAYKGSGACVTSASTKEIVYSVTPSISGTLIITMTPSYDGQLYARSGTNCTDPLSQVACSEIGGVGGLETFTLPVTANTKVSVFADGKNGSAGSYDIKFHLQ